MKSETPSDPLFGESQRLLETAFGFVSFLCALRLHHFLSVDMEIIDEAVLLTADEDVTLCSIC